MVKQSKYAQSLLFSTMAMASLATPRRETCPASYCPAKPQFLPTIISEGTCPADWALAEEVPDWAVQKRGWYPTIRMSSLEKASAECLNRSTAGHSLMKGLEQAQQITQAVNAGMKLYLSL
ncbi:uncharacterized protein B0I36DRAFT_356312 [Microdochium trichocladiopsis]|uniref:Uncharacterized protein n=1 Tax=Microdochium trichocladiopsis TaxID=1682393 RepID=A0A9P8XSA1_9PEZI|nr:uncharacterized protein B0I36DRAFT_356312 [Microdochium trichocladiopsis]KAH7012232.1 hypothetical protein B0I36DRAFT_356312 [Microdochium trichocladiopsis]